MTTNRKLTAGDRFQYDSGHGHMETATMLRHDGPVKFGNRVKMIVLRERDGVEITLYVKPLARVKTI